MRDGMHLCSRWPDGCRGDGMKQVVPVLEDHVGGDGPQMLEEAVFGATRDDSSSPGKNGEIGGGMEGKGQQVEGDEDIGEGLLAVPEAVLEVVSAGLEDVEGLVLYPRVKPEDKPSSAPGRRRPIRPRCPLRPRDL